MSAKKQFSIRQGIEPEPKPALDEAPKHLRYFLLKYLEKRFTAYPHLAAEILEDFLHDPAIGNLFRNPHDPSAWNKMYTFIDAFKWWQIYDFTEAIYNNEVDDYKRSKYVEALNAVLDEENISYRMNYRGQIFYKGSESFETAVNTARSVLAAAGRNTAKNEIHKALEDLNRRPPDLTGALQHAMAALECVAKDACGEKAETLGQIIKKHSERFPPPLDDAVSKLYGFASNRGRHITEGTEPEFKEVELIVGVAATVATYLSR